MSWTEDELQRFGDANELNIATQRRDGTFRSALPIWVVRVGEELYVRSWRGREGSWFRQVRSNPSAKIRAGRHERTVSFQEGGGGLRAEIDAAFRTKYGSGWHVDAMTAPAAAEATFRLVP